MDDQHFRKYIDIINESNQLLEDSTLNQLGVNQSNINNIHTELGLKHDTEWEPLPNKRAAIEAAKGSRAVVAVNELGEAFGIGHWSHPMSGGQQVMVATSDDSYSVQSITKAFARIKGRQFKYFASTQTNQHKDKYQQSSGYTYGAPFLNKAAVFEKIIKSDALQGYKQVREYLMDQIDSDEDVELDKLKSAMQALKAIAENGLESWDGHGFGSRGSRGAMKDFFGTSYDYMVTSAADRFQKNNKLAVQKFIKYIRKEISNIVERAVTGGYTTNGKTAGDWDTERTQVWDRLNKK